MTRHFLFVAIVILSSAPLTAADGVIRFVGVKDSGPVRDSLTDAELPNSAPKAESRHTAVRSVTTHDVSYAFGDPPATDECKNGFRAICDHGCRLEYLGDSCACDTSCCTTDQWCENPCDCAHGNCYLNEEDGTWYCNDKHCDVFGDPGWTDRSALRFGWWASSTDGSNVKTGEYQDLKSSQFWDLDSISSDGRQTLDFSLTGLDNEANNAIVNYYGPGMSSKVKYQRFLRRWDHDPLAAPDLLGTPAPLATDNIVSEDLNVGQDYAIRVQQLDARFQGPIGNNMKWRLNLWGMQKFGERQANSMGHCFDTNLASTPGGTATPLNPANRCHVLSQQQSIDWLTMEVQPVVEAKFGDVSLEYSRTMRSFGQGDQLIGRRYSQFGYTDPGGYTSNFVSENFTQIDRLKVSAQLTEDNQLYANVYLGDTQNKFRDTRRQFGGYDVRLTNRSFDGVTLTGYASMYEENNQLPTTFFTTPPFGTNLGNALQREPGGGPDHPINYDRTRVGVKGNWRPYDDGAWSGFLLAGGYEYYIVARDFAVYTGSARLGTFSQPDTKSHMIEFGPSMQWSPEWKTYVRYKGYFYEDPLIGVRESTGRFNTNQPEQDHRIELGGTWTPASNFMATAQFSLNNSWNQSVYPSNVPAVPINFSEDSYPLYCTAWYAPTDRLSFTGGYAYFSNWIDQDVAIGFRTSPIETTRLRYAGENHLASVNAHYAWTQTVQLTGGYEWDRGTNSFVVPPSTAGANWDLGTGLASYSAVAVETQRLTAGLDWLPYNNTTAYIRYVYFDFADKTQDFNSGTAHMLLGGFTVLR
jgi:hypothetical protein